MFYSRRYGFVGDGVQGSDDPVLLLNLFLEYDLPVDGLRVGAGAFDILDADYRYHQAYDGGHAPVPAPGRDFLARIAYDHPF